MDIDTLLTLGLVMAGVVGVLIALATRRKEGPKKVEELLGHLEAMGIRSSIDTTDARLAEVGRSRGEKNI